MRVVDVARICHEANRAYCYSIGDFSHNDWNNAPEWQRKACIDGVRLILEDNSISPAQLHASWLEQKKSEGWVYGPVKDADKKEHPCMVPYDALPKEHQFKDRLFGHIVRACQGYVECDKKGYL